MAYEIPAGDVEDAGGGGGEVDAVEEAFGGGSGVGGYEREAKEPGCKKNGRIKSWWLLYNSLYLIFLKLKLNFGGIKYNLYMHWEHA